MRVGIDYRVAAAHAPGIGRYVRELTRALIALEDPPRGFGLSLVDIGREPDVVSEQALGLAVAAVPWTRTRWRISRRVMMAAGRWGAPVDRLVKPLEIFHHSRPPLLPISKAKQTIAISDLPKDPAARAELARAVSRCALVFVFGEAGREIVSRELSLAPDRVVVTPVGADHWAREIVDPRSIVPPSRPRVLVLGAQSARREPELLLSACERLAQDGLDFELRITGRKEGGDPKFLEAARRSVLGDRLRFDSPSERDMPRCVAEATVLVHLDRDALTPVSPLEGWAAGCEVIVSDLPVFRDALGENARYATNEATLCAQLEGALRRGYDVDARLERRERARPWSWARCAKATVEAWGALA